MPLVTEVKDLPVLHPFYYLDNFELVLDWVRTRYDDLLQEHERQFIREFFQLPQTSRALFVRMVMRKGEFFRASKLQYEEIGDARLAVQALLELSWVEQDPVMDLDEVFDILAKPEIASAFKLSAAQRQWKKADLLECLLQQKLEHSSEATQEASTANPSQRRYSEWWPESEDLVWRIAVKDICQRFRLMFFGNSHQDWSEFVLSDLGIYEYETIDFSPESRGFQTRRDVDDYEALQSCREAYEVADSVAAMEAVLARVEQLALNNVWIEHRRQKLYFHMGQQAEKWQEWPLALRLYSASRYLGARQRRIRVLEKMGDSAAALELLNRALAAPESEAELQQLQRSAPRLNRKLGHQKPAVIARQEVKTLHLCLPQPQEAISVEYVVRDHLHQDEAPVFYVENTLFNSLLGLLCWPAVFKALPGAFFHPFHRAPVDFSSEDFVPRRAEDFAQCLAMLDSDAYKQQIRETYRLKYGKQSPFVFWDYLDEALLETALQCIPARDLRYWFQRILADIKANRSGFPDLIQFFPGQQSYQLIEVKGPGDRLQDNQLRLIDYCHQHQLPISVCYLQWQEAKL
ncbi:VRR-NUC domain-containing protein [Undibacterium cyanobacteriorum]|uniref:phosphodiesterase I n=1 Tax=Undibacterium cyanobacteriorum TaxID=3073561 RepID=A0ABY9RHI9_9BURK|nr:VRR-NUC domain-containing protein [Undibacterium sp. 20NA77.5]WMW80130.1 VRR-NUC domain-containing protein [Undibacterium sp. 20NA77.5]